MIKMLDIIELFLRYSGYSYLRVDTTTTIVERSLLIERFNHDPTVFVMISTTRLSGTCVTMTGAETVIFYDVDWNPEMNAHMIDQCQRINQSKDLQIYRFVVLMKSDSLCSFLSP